jgi:hypothetical protein
VGVDVAAHSHQAGGFEDHGVEQFHVFTSVKLEESVYLKDKGSG